MTGRFGGNTAVSVRVAAVLAVATPAGWAWPVLADEVKIQPAPQAQNPPPQDPRAEERRRMTQHWEQQLAKLLHSHLALIRGVCADLPREQRRAIALAGEQAMKEAAAQVAEVQMGMRPGPGGKRPAAGGGPGAKGPGPSPGEDPAASITAALHAALAERAGATQAASFAAEVAAREERRKRAVVGAVVVILDTDLFLTADQRAAVERSLLERWDEGMVMAVQGVHMTNGRRVFPGVPDDCIRPHLTEPQRQAFGPPQNANRAAKMTAWQRLANQLAMCEPALKRDPWWFK